MTCWIRNVNCTAPGLTSYFDHIEIMSDKTEKEYTRLLQILQVAPEEFMMIGNSLKSDIQPVLAIGGYGVHIPFEVMWQHEVVDTFAHPRLKQMKSLVELMDWLNVQVKYSASICFIRYLFRILCYIKSVT